MIPSPISLTIRPRCHFRWRLAYALNESKLLDRRKDTDGRGKPKGCAACDRSGVVDIIRMQSRGNPLERQTIGWSFGWESTSAMW